MYLIRGFQAGEGRGKGSQKPIIFKGNRSIALPPPGGGGGEDLGNPGPMCQSPSNGPVSYDHVRVILKFSY